MFTQFFLPIVQFFNFLPKITKIIIVQNRFSSAKVNYFGSQVQNNIFTAFSHPPQWPTPHITDVKYQTSNIVNCYLSYIIKICFF